MFDRIYTINKMFWNVQNFFGLHPSTAYRPDKVNYICRRVSSSPASSKIALTKSGFNRKSKLSNLSITGFNAERNNKGRCYLLNL